MTNRSLLKETNLKRTLIIVSRNNNEKNVPVIMRIMTLMKCVRKKKEMRDVRRSFRKEAEEERVKRNGLVIQRRSMGQKTLRCCNISMVP